MEITTSTAASHQEDEGQVVAIREITGEIAEPPCSITVAGTYSKVYRKTMDAQRERMFKQRRLTLTGEAVSRNQLELVASCVLSWEGFTKNGQPFPCSKENAIELLTAAPWIREQLEEAMGDHAGFSRSSSAS